jgi:hypothetical protein
MISGVIRGRHPFQEIHAQALAQAIADGAYGRTKIPDVWSFDGSRDYQQGVRSIAAAVAAKAPIWSGRHYAKRIFPGAKPKCRNCIALRATKDIGQEEMRPASRAGGIVHWSSLG